MGPGAWRAFPEHIFFQGPMPFFPKHRKKTAGGKPLAGQQGLGAAARPLGAAARPPPHQGRVFAGKKRPCEASHLPDNRGWGPPGRRPKSEKCPRSLWGALGAPLCPPVPPWGPMGPRCAAGLARSALYSCPLGAWALHCAAGLRDITICTCSLPCSAPSGFWFGVGFWT